ncbi:MAG: LysM peptidoglycan-binding domain-containing protein, partial [Anaerolineae bacterium]|nr:LysM peptidoglycan-binding domain-containing protein [Anaerolineae bacterium]
PNAPPCFNAQGQRLRYYDDANRRLETPVYSDLPVYITEPNQTLQQVATILGVCEVDLFRVNQFPDLPINSRIELFIPPVRPCLDNLSLMEVNRKNIITVSVVTNMCPDELMTLNPHLMNDTATHPIYAHDELNESHWVIIDAEKVQHEPCYIRYNAQDGESVFDIERELNVCFEEFILYEDLEPRPFTRIIRGDNVTIFIPYQAMPCYNAQGQRLYYPDGLYPFRHPSNNIIIQRPPPSYSDATFYQSQPSDTVYDISKKFNVCVHDLLRVNPLIRQHLPQGIPIFIPHVRPCYDEATGKQFIYEDNFGNPLPEPVLSDYLVHYGQPIESHLSYYYNACLNRIRSATRSAEIDRLDHYEGYIIPTDRPPCYNPDNDWQPIEYVCYQHPIGHDTIAQPDIEMTFDAEGAYCYDIQNPQTVIWYENQPYKLFWKADETLQLNSRAIQRGVLAWCFGVSLDEINNISRNIGFQPIQPSYFYGWIIPMPTRECYLEYPAILDGKMTHTVEYGETLISIAQEYDVPYPMISVANQLWLGNVIWEGQILIIPSAPQTSDLWWLIPLWLFWGWWCVHIGRMVITQIREKRGWK